MQEKLSSDKRMSTASDVNFRDESNQFFFKEIFGLDSNDLLMDNVSYNS